MFTNNNWVYNFEMELPFLLSPSLIFEKVKLPLINKIIFQNEKREKKNLKVIIFWI